MSLARARINRFEPRTIVRMFFAISALGAAPSSGATGALYTVTDLGTLGGTVTVPTAINDSGEVVGYSSIAGDGASHAFVYSGGMMVDLGTLGGVSSSASAINNSGEIVGASEVSHEIRGDFTHAFAATPLNGKYVMGDLGYFGNDSDPGADFNSKAVGISDAGTIIGTSSYLSQFVNGSQGGFESGGLVGGPLGFELPGFAPVSISNNGTILSGSWGGSGLTPAAINDAGQIVGGSTDGAFLFNPGIGITMIVTLGGNSSYADAINNAGEVVGWADDSDGSQNAFLYINGGVLTDLNTVIPSDSGWLLQSATSINDEGQITGEGWINGQDHGFLLSPVISVPEANMPPIIAFVGLSLLFSRENSISRHRGLRHQVEILKLRIL